MTDNEKPEMASAQVAKSNNISNRENDQSWRPWLVCFSASLFFFYEFMQFNMFNAINPSLMREFSATAEQLGQLSANYFYANILFLFFAGIILDRVSTRALILFAMALSVVGTFVFSLADSLWLASVCRFATGIGAAFCFLGNVRLASRWFPPKRLALVIGLIVMVAMMGGWTAQAPLTWLTTTYGWRMALRADASLGVVFIIIIAAFVRDYPRGFAIAKQEKVLGKTSVLATILSTMKNLQNWFAGLYTCLLNLPIMLLGAMWGSMYLTQAKGFSIAAASNINSMIFFGTIIGAPLLGWLSDRLKRRKQPMIVCAVLSLLVILMVMFLPVKSFWLMMALFFLLGLFTSAQVISYPLIAESNPSALTGTAEGLASTLIMSGGLTQAFFGKLMDLNWHHQLVDGIRVYSTHAYAVAMLIIPIAFILGLVAAICLKETHCVGHD